jgi:hypothetical protein
MMSYRTAQSRQTNKKMNNQAFTNGSTNPFYYANREIGKALKEYGRGGTPMEMLVKRVVRAQPMPEDAAFDVIKYYCESRGYRVLTGYAGTIIKR